MYRRFNNSKTASAIFLAREDLQIYENGAKIDRNSHNKSGCNLVIISNRRLKLTRVLYKSKEMYKRFNIRSRTAPANFLGQKGLQIGLTGWKRIKKQKKLTRQKWL